MQIVRKGKTARLPSKKTIATLDRIEAHDAIVKGVRRDNFVVYTREGETFSALDWVWNRLDINVSQLNRGDAVEITYVENPWKGKMYKNLKSIKVLSRKSGGSTQTAQANPPISVQAQNVLTPLDLAEALEVKAGEGCLDGADFEDVPF